MAPSASLTVHFLILYIGKANDSRAGEAEGTAQALYRPVTNGPAEG
jgi:hypothetical protein